VISAVGSLPFRTFVLLVAVWLTIVRVGCYASVTGRLLLLRQRYGILAFVSMVVPLASASRVVSKVYYVLPLLYRLSWGIKRA